MYTNAGVLQVIGIRNAAANLVLVQSSLNRVESGELEMTEMAFDELVRMEEDIKTHFLHRAEMLGMTNVANKAMDIL